MDRGTALLQGLQKQLMAWRDYIRRCTHATEVSFEPRAEGTFDLVVKWVDKKNVPGQFTKSFTRSFVFGGTATLSPEAWAVEKKACVHARETVQEILVQRGVV